MAWHTASNRASARNVAKLEMLFITPLPSPLPQGEREFILKACLPSSRLAEEAWRSYNNDAYMRLHTPSPLVGEGWGEGGRA